MSTGDDRSPETRMRVMQDFAARAYHRLTSGTRDAAALELIERLDEAGVPVLLLKGPVLARVLYRADEQRGYVDVDILVRRSELVPARAVLLELGYKNVSDRAGVDDFMGVLHSETWSHPYGCSVDLHWRLAGCEAPPEDAWACLYQSRDTITLDGRPIAVLGRAGLTLHLCTHAAQGGLEDVKALADLTRGLERWPFEDWRAAARLAEELGGTEAFAAGLRLVPEGVTMAEMLELPATDSMSWTILHRPVRPRGTFHVRALGEAGGWTARINVLRRSLLPSRSWITAELRWARRGRPALVAGYALHLLRAPLWALRAWRFDRRARRASARKGSLNPDEH